ncbi:MAG: hypothetical protein E7471_06000 [Ruminococcaceae bacterium]|nr:hypothetical protein [Oscillospiraceae bacterium]
MFFRFFLDNRLRFFFFRLRLLFRFFFFRFQLLLNLFFTRKFLRGFIRNRLCHSFCYRYGRGRKFSQDVFQIKRTCPRILFFWRVFQLTQNFADGKFVALLIIQS